MIDKAATLAPALMDKVNDFLGFNERMADAMYKASHVDNYDDFA